MIPPDHETRQKLRIIAMIQAIQAIYFSLARRSDH